LYKLMMGLARLMALLGGLTLSALILLTCASIVGRELNGLFHSGFFETVAPGFARWMLDLGTGPINGDFEIVESGMAFAIFAFIPYCQITAGHASVDLLVSQFPAPVQRALRMLVEILFAAVLILISWRLCVGMQDKIRYAETTFLLQFPVWWAYAASFAASVTAAIVGVYMACVRVIECVTGRIIVWDGTEEVPQ
tara:strand:- start:1498 stop:2085 length:588 start_codon:yes stop_codon:yes gene_type:complete